MTHLQLLLAVPSLGLRVDQLGRAKSPLAVWLVRCLTAPEEAAAGMGLSSIIGELLPASLTGDSGLHALGTGNLVPGHRRSDAMGASDGQLRCLQMAFLAQQLGLLWLPWL